MTSIRTFGSPTPPPVDSTPIAWAPINLGELVDPLGKNAGSTDTSPSVTDFGFPESQTSSRTSAGSTRHGETAVVGKEEGPVVSVPPTEPMPTGKAKRKSVPWTTSMRDLDSHAKLPPVETFIPEQRYIPVRTSSKLPVPSQPTTHPPAEKEHRRPSDQETFDSRFSLTRTDEETGYETYGSVPAVRWGAEGNSGPPPGDETAARTPRRQKSQPPPPEPATDDDDDEATRRGILSTRRRHRRRARKLQKAAEDAVFVRDAERLPTRAELVAAGALQVFAVDGKRVAFRDVVSSSLGGQTVCVFIRHW